MDRCGSKNIGGSPIYETAFSGSSGVKFNGTYSLTFPASVYMYTSFSISFWLKLNGGTGTVFDYAKSLNTNRIQYLVSAASKAELLFYTGSGSTTKSSFITYSFQTGVWVQITNTFETGQAKSYINGALSKTSPLSGYTVNAVSRGNSRLGTDKDQSAFMSFSITDYRIYNRVLSDIEVANIV